MLICPRDETADAVIHGLAVFVIIIFRVARCNDRILRPFPGTLSRWDHHLFFSRDGWRICHGRRPNLNTVSKRAR